jgi:hypothetical protein
MSITNLLALSFMYSAFGFYIISNKTDDKTS